MVSSRVNGINESATVSMSNKAAELKAAGKTIYSFGIGEPDFTTPEEIIDYAFKEAREGKTHYTPSAGIMELREKIAEKMKKKNNIDATASNVLVTPTKFSLNLALYSIIDPGEEVLLPAPYYVSYPDIIKLNQGKTITVPTDENYEFDFQEMKKYISPKTKAFMFNNPVNPTGKVYSEKSLRALADFILENDLYLISDEIYEDLIYKGRMFSPGSIEEMKDKTVTLSGFSKSYAMTGWRIGYMVAPLDIIKAANKVQQQTLTCAPSISQYGAMKALEDEESVAKMRQEFAKRRDLTVSLLKEIDGITLYEPEGAFYAFPGYSTEKADDKLSMELLEKYNVIVTPGSPFGAPGHFRISYATSQDVIREGIGRIEKYFNNL
ncbi:pyridoxal phosphate-dependent aminotransferase [Ferroplasma acidiphilum]|uniref:pyridoxal phosphate-dependent aminotransferase n=1 Tax=Ferroplasma acidiphilum TaxID=74969 RepID=UPI0023F509F2|nr:pyridoxal phosphate-dependent aminotransferase [Ferroplasma acidiphilum]MCL4349604.1 pyridoxal phosphate-dependent aminotransferase [Candidatus Thermoplasmatota archaeon]